MYMNIVKHITGTVGICLCAGLLLTCASAPAESVITKEQGPVLLLEPLLLKSIVDPAGMEPLESFGENLFVGYVMFSGGIIQDPEMGNRFRSKNIELRETDYGPRISQIITGMLTGALEAKGIQVFHKPVPAVVSGPGGEPLLTAKPDALMEDPVYRDTDNINFPYRSRIITVSPEIKARIRTEGYPEKGLLLIPVIDCAYSHTGGWFYAREFGCHAGIRIIVQVIGVDLKTGTVSFRFREDFKHIEKLKPLMTDDRIFEIFNDFALRLNQHFSAAVRKQRRPPALPVTPT
jgi:hypothetical protein